MEARNLSPNQLRRLQRMYTERFYVLHTEYDEATQSGHFKVSGSTGSVYTVGLNGAGAFDCDCPDSIGRLSHEPDLICKHRCFVLYKVSRCDVETVSPSPRLRGSALKRVRQRLRDSSADPSTLSANVSDPALRANYERIVGAVEELISGPSFEAPPLLGDQADDCAVCYDSLAEGARLACPDCRNSIHKDCMMRWVRSGKITCPFCRSKCWERLDPRTGRTKPLQAYVNVFV